MRAVGPKIIAVHKGFGLVGGNNRPYASPVDVGPAAKANPDIKFVIYHSGFEPGDNEGPYTDATADVGVNRLIKTAIENGIGKGGNVYPELGSTWRSVMSDPTQAAHVLGKLLKQFGEDRVVWGTDSIWYGSPQDQIQAFRAFEITPQFQEQFGYPALTQAVKEKILGKNVGEDLQDQVDRAGRTATSPARSSSRFARSSRPAPARSAPRPVRRSPRSSAPTAGRERRRRSVPAS